MVMIMWFIGFSEIFVYTFYEAFSSTYSILLLEVFKKNWNFGFDRFFLEINFGNIISFIVMVFDIFLWHILELSTVWRMIIIYDKLWKEATFFGVFRFYLIFLTSFLYNIFAKIYQKKKKKFDRKPKKIQTQISNNFVIFTQQNHLISRKQIWKYFDGKKVSSIILFPNKPTSLHTKYFVSIKQTEKKSKNNKILNPFGNPKLFPMEQFFTQQVVYFTLNLLWI